MFKPRFEEWKSLCELGFCVALQWVESFCEEFCKTNPGRSPTSEALKKAMISELALSDFRKLPTESYLLRSKAIRDVLPCIRLWSTSTDFMAARCVSGEVKGPVVLQVLKAENLAEPIIDKAKSRGKRVKMNLSGLSYTDALTLGEKQDDSEANIDGDEYPDEGDKTSSTNVSVAKRQKRVLRFTLTDGATVFTAIEQEPLDGLLLGKPQSKKEQRDFPPPLKVLDFEGKTILAYVMEGVWGEAVLKGGYKLLIRDYLVQNGVILLNGRCARVLGGCTIPSPDVQPIKIKFSDSSFGSQSKGKSSESGDSAVELEPDILLSAYSNFLEPLDQFKDIDASLFDESSSLAHGPSTLLPSIGLVSPKELTPTSPQKAPSPNTLIASGHGTTGIDMSRFDSKEMSVSQIDPHVKLSPLEEISYSMSHASQDDPVCTTSSPMLTPVLPSLFERLAARESASRESTAKVSGQRERSFEILLDHDQPSILPRTRPASLFESPSHSRSESYSDSSVKVGLFMMAEIVIAFRMTALVIELRQNGFLDRGPTWQDVQRKYGTSQKDLYMRHTIDTETNTPISSMSDFQLFERLSELEKKFQTATTRTNVIEVAACCVAVKDSTFVSAILACEKAAHSIGKTRYVFCPLQLKPEMIEKEIQCGANEYLNGLQRLDPPILEKSRKWNQKLKNFKGNLVLSNLRLSDVLDHQEPVVFMSEEELQESPWFQLDHMSKSAENPNFISQMPLFFSFEKSGYPGQVKVTMKQRLESSIFSSIESKKLPIITAMQSIDD